MKNVLRMMLLAAVAALFTAPAYAQDAAAQSAASPQDVQAKADLYAKFLQLIKGGPAEQKQASEVGKEYLGKYATPEDDIVKYIRGWVEKYDKAVRDFEFKEAVAKNPGRAFQIGREQPDNLDVQLALVQAGFNAAAAKNTAHNAEAAQAARRALEMIEGGKTTTSYLLFANRDEAVGGLPYMIGYFLRDTNPQEAAQALVKAAQSNSKFKTEPTTYAYLGRAYYDSEFKQLAADYKARFEGKEETDESRAAYEKLMQSLDRVIDAFARSAALSKDPAQKKAIMDQLTAFYKSRNADSEAGLNEYVAGVLSRPLPGPGQLAQPAVAPGTAPSA
ncbi:MAG TPA: hypothetical protein VN228_16350, partial [Pyrinomonadaceae bacterium]|nr:hypothetical protein [Pyrinomonadaceae bacterium]